MLAIEYFRTLAIHHVPIAAHQLPVKQTLHVIPPFEKGGPGGICSCPYLCF